MKTPITLLLQSRKFYVGMLTLLAVAGAVTLRSLELIPADALIPTIAAISTTGAASIGAIAWESTSADKLEAEALKADANKQQMADYLEQINAKSK